MSAPMGNSLRSRVHRSIRWHLIELGALSCEEKLGHRAQNRLKAPSLLVRLQAIESRAWRLDLVAPVSDVYALP
jgi:hypothetical protein